jgi:membrane protein DedA with SNARE-associated domain
MRLDHFLGAIFAGRFVRFLVLALLTLWFGPQIVTLAGNMFKQHFYWVLAAVAGATLAWLLLRRNRKRKSRIESASH